MRRTSSFVVAWAVAAAVATVIAWQGIAVVGNQVTSSRPAALDQTEVEARLEAPTSTPPVSSTTSTSTTIDGEGAPDSEGPAARPDSPAGPGSSASSQQDPPGASANTTPPTTSSPSTTTVAQTAEVRTYNLVGGTAALRFSSSGVTVEYATPKVGFTVEFEPEHGNGVKVEFESADHKSRVDGWWQGGPQDRIREDSDNGSGSGSDDD